MGSTALGAAVACPGKTTWISCKGQRSIRKEKKKYTTTTQTSWKARWHVLTVGTHLCTPAWEQRENTGTWKNQDILLTRLEKKENEALYKPLPASVTQACHRVFYLVLGVKRLCQPHSCGLINWNQTQTSKRLRKHPWMWRNVCCLCLCVICTCVFLHSDLIRKHISLSWIISCT